MNKTVNCIIPDCRTSAMDGMGRLIKWASTGFFTARRSLGLMFLVCAVLLKQGMDFHDEADELYALYEAA